MPYFTPRIGDHLLCSRFFHVCSRFFSSCWLCLLLSSFSSSLSLGYAMRRRTGTERNCKLTLYRHFAVVTCPVAASCFFSRAPTWLSICTNKLQHTPPQLSPIRASSFSSLPPTLQLPPVLLVLPKASIYLSTRFFSPPFLLELVFYLGGVTTSAYSHSNFRTRPAQKPYLGFQSLASFSSLLRHTHLIS